MAVERDNEAVDQDVCANLNIPKPPPDDDTESEESEDEPQCEGDECELYEEEVITEDLLLDTYDIV